MISSVITV